MKKNQTVLKIPIFKINYEVCYNDNFSFNPAYKVLSVGLIKGIHIYRGKGMYVNEKPIGKILYTVSGCSELKREKELSRLE